MEYIVQCAMPRAQYIGREQRPKDVCEAEYDKCIERLEKQFGKAKGG